jgi:DNA-binding CsgD family transcriptional regulator
MGQMPLGIGGAQAEAAIARLCTKGLPPLELFEQVAHRLRAVVPYAAGCWKPTDPDTLLFTGFAIEDPTPGTLRSVCWRFVDNELLEPDYAKFRTLARKPMPVTTLHKETHGEAERSGRYRRIHRKLGFGAELRAVFRRGEACWGSVALVRRAGEPDFSRNELAFVARLCDHLALGVREALLNAATHSAQGAEQGIGPGVIVLRDDLSVESTTPEAAEWLQRFPADIGTGLELPASLYAVAAATRASKAYKGSASSRVRLSSGQWVVVHAAPLAAAGPSGRRVAVMLTPAAPADLTPLRLELYELTEREAEVTRLVARGLSVDEIARCLYISRYTVKDHIKAIYAKVGVTNRPELSAKLFYEHHLPVLGKDGVREFTPAVA